MSELSWALRAIQDAPQGPQVAAFFDLDGTLVRGYTAASFIRDQWARKELSAADLRSILQGALNHRISGSGLGFIERCVELLAGRELDALERQARQVFAERIALTIRPDARALVLAHKRAGHTLVMASAASPFQAKPVAQDLNIQHLLVTEVEVVDGRLTGKVDGAPRWGREKARAVTDFAQAHGIDLNQSFAYGNGHEDQFFLSAVGRPVAVCPEPGLKTFADAHGIPTLALDNPPTPGLRGIAGTLAGTGAFNLGLTATLAATRFIDKRAAFRYGFPRTADAVLAACGVRLNVQGRAHIDDARPAIFIFNHQSNLDPVVVASLIREDMTGVSKREVIEDPRSWILRYLDIALIDRSNPEQARASVQALIDRIHGGESVLIAPEGTRMPTPTLGHFKRGAFHLALDAGVPIVPIVLRNTGELWPRGTPLVTPGVVDVCVLPPVPTDGWAPEDVGQHADAIRAMYVQTLENWPTDTTL